MKAQYKLFADTSSFLRKEADNLVEKLNKTQSKKEKQKIIKELFNVRNRIAYEIKSIERFIQNNDL